MRLFEGNNALMDAFLTSCRNITGNAESIEDMIIFVDYYDLLPDDIRFALLDVILNKDKTQYVLQSTAKNAVIRDLHVFFPSHIVKKSLRDTTRARHFIAAARLDLAFAMSFLPVCESAIADFKWSTDDLNFVRAHLAPHSDKIKLQCVLLATREYKKCNLAENIVSLNIIFEVFNTLTEKVKKQMVKLITNIVNHHYQEMSHAEYYGYMEKLLMMIQTQPKLVEEYYGLCDAALVSSDGVPDIVVQYGLGNRNRLIMETFNTASHQCLTVGSSHFAHGDEIIHPDYFFKYPNAFTPTFEDIIISYLHCHNRINRYVLSYMNYQPKLAELIICLRVLNCDHVSIFNIEKLYEPLAFLEEKYDFPLRERFQNIVLETFDEANNRLAQIMESTPLADIRRMSSLLWGTRYSENESVPTKVNKIIEDLILHMLPEEKLRQINVENIVCGTIHPLNLGKSSAISYYESATNAFVQSPYTHEYLKVRELDNVRETIRDCIKTLHHVLMEEAVVRGFTDEELNLYF